MTRMSCSVAPLLLTGLVAIDSMLLLSMRLVRLDDVEIGYSCDGGGDYEIEIELVVVVVVGFVGAVFCSRYNSRPTLDR